MSAGQEKLFEGLFMKDERMKKAYKEFTYSTLRSNGYIPQLILVNETGDALTEQISEKNDDIGKMLAKFDDAFDLGAISTRSDNGWFADILTSQRTKQQMQMYTVGDKKPAMPMGGGQPPRPPMI